MLPNNNSIWKQNNYCKTLHTKIMIIAHEFTKDTLPCGNENNRNRAENLLRSCSVLCSSIKYINCQSRIELNKHVLMIKTNVELSMKKKVVNSSMDIKDKNYECYTAFLSFDAATKKLLSYPHSMCACYDGRHFCSDLLAFLFHIRYAQRCKKKCIDFENALPEIPMSMQNELALM